jgi:hypothetical protein
MAEPPPDRELALWLYGVVRADAPDPPRCAGVDERYAVELIRHRELAAVASAVPLAGYRPEILEQQLEDLDRLAALARAHHRVLDETLRLGPVVPLPICTISTSADHVREMLDRESHALAAALRRLSGNAEWGVKAYLDDAGEPLTEAAPGPRPASGIAYLDRKRGQRDAAAAARRTVDAAVELIHGDLTEAALAGVVLPAQNPRLSGEEREMVLNAAYLVPEARSEAFATLVRSLARRTARDGLALELTGPWPAYHFAEAAAAP